MARALAPALALAFAASCGDAKREPPPASSLVVETEGAGWIRITGAELLAAGFDSLSDPATLGLSHRGAPVALRVVPRDATTMFEVEAVEFWAWSSGSLYQSTDAWLLGAQEAPLRIADEAPARVPGTPSLRGEVRAARETYYAMAALNGEASNWFWDYVYASGGPAAKELTIDARLVAAEGTARLTAELHGFTYFDEIAPDHHVRVTLNGNPIADVTSDGNAPLVITADVPASWIVEGENRIGLALPLDTGASFETVLVKSLSLEFPRRAATGAGLQEITMTPGTIALGGAIEGTEAFDVTDPARPSRVSRAPSVAAIPPPSDDAGDPDAPAEEEALEIAAATPARVVIVPPGAKRSPLRMRALRGSDPFATSTPADLLVVAPEALAPAAERLAAHRRATGTTARVVVWEHAVDHVGRGYADPRTLAALVAGLEPAPKWVLLVGDASYDPRGVNATLDGAASNLLPATFGDTPFLETPSDNAVVAPSTRARPELAVGRIPAATLAEAEAVVDKIIAYDTAAAPLDDVLLLADDATTSWEYQLFIATSDQIDASLAQEPFVAMQLYLSSGGGNATTVRTSFFEALEAGAAWVNFMGHGNFTRWAAEGVLVDDDVPSLPESDVLPVFSAANCLTAHWTHPNAELRGLGERLLLEPRRGAVAVLGSTALVYPEGQAELTLAVTNALLVDGAPTIGDALVLAKSNLDPALAAHGDILASWTLLGDPSMRVRSP